MKPYKGIVKIFCKTKDTCPRRVRENVLAGCITCPAALVRIMDLEDRVLAEINPAAPKKQAKNGKSTQGKEDR